MRNRLNSLWALQTFQVRTILWNRLTTSYWYLASLSKPYISFNIMAILSDVDGQISTLTKCYCTGTALYNHKIQFFQIAIRKSTHMWKKIQCRIYGFEKLTQFWLQLELCGWCFYYGGIPVIVWVDHQDMLDSGGKKIDRGLNHSVPGFTILHLH